jgi:hypothetical protein
MKELVDIASWYTSGEEVVMAVFIQDDGEVVPGSSQWAPPKAASKGAKRSAKGNKRGPKRRPQWVIVTTSCNEGQSDKEDDDSDDELIAATKCD